MRDGVRLAVDVTLPATVAPGERLPTILHQTRYWRRTRLRWPASMFVDALDAQGRLGAIERRFLAQGYAWVDVDVRGSGASFGTRSRPSGNADADSDSAPSRGAPPCTVTTRSEAVAARRAAARARPAADRLGARAANR
jgi:putative CocE/NonD family hydrolase